MFGSTNITNDGVNVTISDSLVGENRGKEEKWVTETFKIKMEASVCLVYIFENATVPLKYSRHFPISATK